jgi:hypothetical protein
MDQCLVSADCFVAFSSSSSSLHFQLRPACGLHEYTSQAALEHTQATISIALPAWLCGTQGLY